MTTSYRSRRDAAVADEFLQGHGLCTFCGVSAEWKTLSDYGARCGACYQAYLTGGRSSGPPLTREQKLVVLGRMREAVRRMQASRGPRSWATRLQQREAAGHALTLFQRDAWRRVAALDSAPALLVEAYDDQSDYSTPTRAHALPEVAP